MSARRFRKRSTWLAARRHYLGASDSPVLFGEGYAEQSPWSVWDAKVHGEAELSGDTWRLRVGQVLEQSIAELYQERSGNTVRVPSQLELWVGPDPLAATLDATLDVPPEEAPVPVEIKNVGQHNAADWGECPKCDGAGCPSCYGCGRSAPLRYVIQLQHQMLVTGAGRGVLVALVGGVDLQIREIQRHDAFCERLLSTAREFWLRYVEPKESPPVDASAAAAAAVARLFQHEQPGLCVPLPEQSGMWLAERERCKAAIKALSSRVQQCETALKLCMGDAEYGIAGDGRYVRWSTVRRKEYTVAASESRQLRVIKTLPKGIEYVHDYEPPEISVEWGADGEAINRDGQPRLAPAES